MSGLKQTLSTLVLGSSLLMSAGCSTLPSNYRQMSFDEIITTIKTPEQAQEYLENVKFVVHNDGEVYSPLELFNKQEGVCRDAAAFAAAALEDDGYSPKNISFKGINKKGKDIGHAIFVYEKDGKLNTLGHSKSDWKTGMKDYEDVVATFAKDMGLVKVEDWWVSNLTTFLNSTRNKEGKGYIDPRLYDFANISIFDNEHEQRYYERQGDVFVYHFLQYKEHLEKEKTQYLDLEGRLFKEEIYKKQWNEKGFIIANSSTNFTSDEMVSKKEQESTYDYNGFKGKTISTLKVENDNINILERRIYEKDGANHEFKVEISQVSKIPAKFEESITEDSKEPIVTEIEAIKRSGLQDPLDFDVFEQYRLKEKHGVYLLFDIDTKIFEDDRGFKTPPKEDYRKMSFEEVMLAIKTPEQVKDYLSRLKYDEKYSNHTALTTHKTQKADGKNAAIFAAAVLSDDGYEPLTFGFTGYDKWGGSVEHRVFIYEKNGKFNTIGINETDWKTDLESYEAVVASFAKDFKLAKIKHWDVNNLTTLLKKIKTQETKFNLESRLNYPYYDMDADSTEKMYVKTKEGFTFYQTSREEELTTKFSENIDLEGRLTESRTETVGEGYKNFITTKYNNDETILRREQEIHDYNDKMNHEIKTTLEMKEGMIFIKEINSGITTKNGVKENFGRVIELTQTQANPPKFNQVSYLIYGDDKKIYQSNTNSISESSLYSKSDFDIIEEQKWDESIKSLKSLLSSIPEF